MSKIISMSERANNAKLTTPEQLLETALEEIRSGGQLSKVNKMIILHLDDTDCAYHVGFLQAGMLLTECNNLCDYAKTIIKGIMGFYNNDDYE